MIIKKPYAFLIKHFRLIHLILSSLLIFLAYKTHSVYKFFNDYVKNGYYTYSSEISGTYINFYMFLAIVGILVVAAFIYLLMKWKKKSRLYYILVSIFYMILFIGLLVYFNTFLNLLNEPLGVQAVRAYRDIIFMLYVPQYLFIIFGLIRGIGFDIKKFDFKKDLADLDIKEEDQEEIEVTFGQNSYKYKRKARRAYREIKYYAIENKFFFGVICGTLALVLILVVYVNLNVFTKKYKENDFFTVDGVVFQVLDSYETDMDLKGNKINSLYKYIVIKVSMKNTNEYRTNLETRNLRLMLDDKIYYPTLSKFDYFRDLGRGYTKENLYSGETYEYLFVYEIPKDTKYNKATFRMIDSINIVNGEISSKHKDVRLNTIKYMELEPEEQVYMKSAISLEKSTLLKSEIVVNSYEIGDRFIENYNYCVASGCYDGTRIIAASVLGNQERSVLKLNLDVMLDENLYINRFITNNTKFYEAFGDIMYLSNGELVKAPVVVKTMDLETKNVYLEVPSNIKNSPLIRFVISIRNRKYIVTLTS